MIEYDFELRAYRERLRAATGVGPGDHVLDIGCGAGQSTRDAARAAAPGHVLGVDVSAPMLERARRLTIAEHLDNVTYEHGDAQVHPFAPATTTSPSAGSERCSSPIPGPPSATSRGHCA
jgi:ubiquinone/menaquinone biosynthesis C-methylase UbiE